jgi:hypothetical protein
MTAPIADDARLVELLARRIERAGGLMAASVDGPS